MSEKIQNVLVRDVEVDEIWAYVGKKEGNKPEPEWKNEMIGDAYTFVGMERHSKLVLAWHLGRRNGASTMFFMQKLRHAIDTHNWFQLTSDGSPVILPPFNTISAIASITRNSSKSTDLLGKANSATLRVRSRR